MWLFKTQEQKGSLRCALSPAVTGSRCILVEKVLEHGKRAWSCYRAHLQHPVTLSKALLPNLVQFAPEQTLSIHSDEDVSRSSQPKDSLRAEHPPTLSAESAAYYFHLLVSHSSTGRSVWLIPSFDSFRYFTNFCDTPPDVVVSFLDYFVPFSCCSSYRSCFTLLIILVALFWNFCSLSTAFWERPELHAELKGWANQQICVVTWWWWPVSSPSLSWQLLIPAFPQPAYWWQARIVLMELSTITQSFYCWEKQSAHFLYMKLGLFHPPLHICLHQISSVILLPTQPSKLLLQLCTIIFAILNKLLTLYHQQTSLLSSMTGLNSTSLCTDFICFFFP